MTNFKTSFTLTVAACVAPVVLPTGLEAEALQRAPDTGRDWRFSVTPFLFLPLSTTGTSVVEGGEVDLDLSGSDVLDLLEGAASLRFEAWNGDWGIISDVYYVHLNPNGDIEFPGPLNGSAEVDVTIKQGWVSLLGAYRFAHGTNAAGNGYAIDASAGVRWNSVEQTVDIDGDIPIGSGLTPNITLGQTESWFEPMVGLRGAVQVDPNWMLLGRADLGGFGVNGNDLQYSVLFGADWKPWERTSLLFGYQFYGIDFSTGSGSDEFTYDIDQNGFITGLAIRF